MSSDILDARKLQFALSQIKFQRLHSIQLTYLQSIDSTQDYAKSLHVNREGDLVIAGIQTGGKGREGRSWVSPAGGLWMTITLRPPSAVMEKMIDIGSNAIKKTLEEYGLDGVEIKPPNDVCRGGRKIAGLLADSLVQGGEYRVFLGIGVDVNNDTSQDSAIAEIATSVKKELGGPVDLSEFTISLLNNFDGLYFQQIQSQLSYSRRKSSTSQEKS